MSQVYNNSRLRIDEEDGQKVGFNGVLSKAQRKTEFYIKQDDDHKETGDDKFLESANRTSI